MTATAACEKCGHRHATEKCQPIWMVPEPEPEALRAAGIAAGIIPEVVRRPAPCLKCASAERMPEHVVCADCHVPNKCDECSGARKSWGNDPGRGW